MKVRNKEHTWTGFSSNFNTHGLGEVIVGFDGDGGMDSMYISDLEVYLDSKNTWKDMKQAFKDDDLIIDNYNTCFREPHNQAEIDRGYF
jgi:hypothetical protein